MAAIVDKSAILATAGQGINELIAWATAGGKPPVTHTYEACRCQLRLPTPLDDVGRLLASPSDAAAAASYVHVDKSTLLQTIESNHLQVELRYGIFKAPVPFMRDRDATYIECFKHFTDGHGRRGVARYLTSHELPTTTPNASYVRVDIRTWGIVVVESSDPLVLHASSVVDVDWKSVSAYIGSHMTTRRAQSVKHLDTVVRASLKKLFERCSMCLTKPSSFERANNFAACVGCAKPLCPRVRVAICLACAGAKARAKVPTRETLLESEASTVESDTKSPTVHRTPRRMSCESGWLTPQYHRPRRPTEAPLDLTYLASFQGNTA
ncbi:hypothetical protein SPRG_10176 [Saprolegnia parasitica CBS 223.65]|uniref:START domain-containing protein n=1 Tax=Saprolegnia parasitica (strain CBS 223.65) TaxID=695850 RepID=A0A067C297_SAPPC|nr:hypothetical protein SPRG_10176 [Saprolegnia parasitica CBS 223.65]KDO24643.1 hypothetical protein SPRG_10176 [Saprolegnia parasitica CBS 223.65]|eukprot:XP_012204711.1 hypothetical protein SPRG_10176 [Saprolegnia parasitica CBS 223.65]